MRLPDDTGLQVPLEVQRDVRFVAQHLADGNARPPRDHLADEVVVDHDLDEWGLSLQRPQLARQPGELGPQRVPGLAAAIASRSLAGARLEPLADVPDLGDQVAFPLPARFQRSQTPFRLSGLVGELAQALGVIRADGALALEHPGLHRQIVQRAHRVLERGRKRVLAQGQPGARGVQHAHGLVRQLPIGQIAMRQPHRRLGAVVQDPHLVMLLERRDDTPHHDQARLLRRLLHLHQLEASRERGIFLEVLLVLGPRRRGDGAQLAARQGRLQQVGGVALAGRPAGADHRVRLVDEQDDRRGRRADLLDQPFEAVLELALDARAGLQQRKIERPQADVAQHRRDVALRDPHGEAFDHCGLADAGFAHEDGIVLAPPREDIDHLADFEVPSQHRVERAQARPFGEVDGVLVEVRRLAARRSGRVARCGRRPPCRRGLLDGALHDGREILAQTLAGDLGELTADVLHQPAQLVVRRQRQDGVAGADRARAVIHGADEPRAAQHLGETRAERRRPGVAGLELVQTASEIGREPGAVHFVLLEDVGEVPIARVEQLHQEMLDLDVVVRA